MTNAPHRTAPASAPAAAPGTAGPARWLAAIRQRPHLLLAAILATAFGLRVWNLDAGVPYKVGIDEPFIMVTAVQILKTGDFNPHFFDYPGLYIYLQAAVMVVVYMAGALQGSWSALAHFGSADAYVWSRLVTACLGTATACLVYAIAGRWSRAAALLAAAAMAVAPMHVRESHYVLTDVPMTFFVSLAALLTLRAVESPGPRRFFWAGVAVGLAGATKYNGAYSVIMPLLAWALMGPARPAFSRSVVPVVLGAAAAFLAFAPFTVLDLPGFLNAWGELARHYRPRSALVEPGWSLYLRHLRLNWGWVGFLLSAGGLALALRGLAVSATRVKAATLAAFPLFYFWQVADGALAYGRYMLPVLPFMAAWIGIAVSAAAARPWPVVAPRWQPLVLAGLVAVALGFPAWTSVSFNLDLGRTTTASMAWDWLSRSTMAGTGIVTDARDFQLPGERYPHREVTAVTEADLAPIGGRPVEVVITSSDAWGRGESTGAPNTLPASRRFLMARALNVRSFQPGSDVTGPTLVIVTLRRE